jgi:transposase
MSLVDRRLHQGPERIRVFEPRMTRIGLAKMTEYPIGIDISKSYLDAFRLEDQTSFRFENSARRLRALTSCGLLQNGLVRRQFSRIVFEPTGPYHRAHEKALSGKFPLAKFNPLQARRFAQACGTRAKTDTIDARILAQMGGCLEAGT